MPYAELLTFLGCVLLSVLFSGAETALNSLGQTRQERLIERLKASGRNLGFLGVWAERRNEALTCILIGNNVVNITASALATVAFERVFAGTAYIGFAVPTAIGVATFVILTFGEIVPKTFAQNNPERFALVARVLLQPIHQLLKPLTWLFARLSEWLIRKSGGNIAQGTITVTEQDIENHIERAAQQGNLDADQKRLLSSVFEFDDTLVNEVMKPRTEIVGLPRDAKLQEVLEVIERSQYSRFPVYEVDLDHVVGVLHVRDLLGWFGRPHGGPIDLGGFMREPYFVPESKNIRELLREMQESRTPLAIVVDEFGGTAGLATVEDIVEEVFGEIYDEYDHGQVGEDLVRRLDERSWEVEAKVSIRDVEDALDMEIADEDLFSTLGGFILAEAGSIPEEGSQIRKDELVYTVLEADTKRVIRVRIDRETAPILEDTGS